MNQDSNRTRRWLTGASLAWTMLVALASHATVVPSGFSDGVVWRPDGGAWESAQGVAFGGDGRAFVWERGGRVWVLDGARPQTTPVVDLSDEVSTIGALGLTGFALDPQVDQNGFVYLFYAVDPQHLSNCGAPRSGAPQCRSTYRPGQHAPGGATIARLVRFQLVRLPGRSDFQGAVRVDVSTRQTLLGETASTGPTGCVITDSGHGSGALAFGTDGTLLASCGDGASTSADDAGSQSDTQYQQALAQGLMTRAENVGAFRAQLLASLSGKVLRLDPATGSGLPSNPFYDPTAPRSARSRVWALGLHDPQRFSVRPGSGSLVPADGQPGTLYIGDLGYSTWEALDVARTGGTNFGWPLYEGAGNDTTRYAGLSVFNLDAPTDLNRGACSQRYYRFRELIREESLKDASWPNPCGSSTTAPLANDVFLRTRPVIDWLHGGAHARWAAFDAAGEPLALTLGTAAPNGRVVTGPLFGGTTSVGGVWYAATDFPASFRNVYFHADAGGQWIKAFAFDPNDNPVAVQNFLADAGPVRALAAAPAGGGLFYISGPAASELHHLTYSNHTQTQSTSRSSSTAATTTASSVASSARARGGSTLTTTISPAPVRRAAMAAASVPAPWASADIGVVGATGSYSSSNGVYTVSGSGGDIWGSVDAFQYVYQTLNGDGTITARVVSQTNTSPYAKAGVMIRETLAANSTYAGAYVTPTSGLEYQARTTTGGGAVSFDGSLVAAPYWVRVVRSGTTFTGYTSVDGVTWTPSGTYTISMAAQVYVGLAVTSHNEGVLSTATFDNVTVTGGTPAVTVAVSPTSVSLGVGATQQFTATVTNAANTAVTWQVNGVTGGNATTGTISAAGLYTAPATVTTTTNYTVTAVSVQAPTASGSATVTVTPPVTVTISPTSATVTVGKTKQFTATVTNATNPAVTWQVNGITGGNATVGQISVAGLYKAPATVSATTKFTVAAVSVQAPTAKASAIVTVPTVVSIAISPTSASLNAGNAQQFTATVTNATNTAVTWKVNGVVGGNSTVGTISTAGLYTAPATVTTTTSYTVTAVSVQAPTVSASATVTVAPPVTVAVSPATASINVGGTQQFTATVTNAANTAVTWQVNGVTGGNATTGTISTAGLYTAPASVSATTSYTITAVSVQAPTATASATITVTPILAVTVAVSPTTATIAAGATQQFTATVTNATNTAVTWQVNGVTGGNATTGTISAAGLYTAPATVSATTNYTVTAVSVQSPTATGSATVTVTPVLAVTVAVSPTSASISAGATQQFTATVTNAANTTVTWQVNGVTGGNATTGTVSTSGLYTAPASVGSPTNYTVTAVSVQAPTSSGSATITVTPVAASNWTGVDIGVVGATGSYSSSNGVYTVSGSGGDIWGSVDAFQYVYQTLNGDGTITARVVSQTNTSAYAKAGVMIRETLAANSTYAGAYVTPTSGLEYQARTTTGGGAVSFDGSLVGAPYWVRVVRSGTTFTGYTSVDGVTWTPSGTYTISMAAQVYVGLAVTSHNEGVLSTATFDNVTVTGGTPAVTVAVSPTAVSLGVGATQQFTATVTNAANTAVTWQVNGVTGGNATTGTISAAGLYTAPATVSATTNYTVTAVSVQAPTASASATVTVSSGAGVTVTVAPSSAAISAGATQQFTATVTNASNTAVTWQVNGITGGNGTVGTISTAGLYTAPATVSATTNYTVTAVSVQTPTASGSATVTVSPAAAVTVTVAPTTATIAAGATQQFTATVTNASDTSVTWQVNGITGGNATIGTISTAGLYTAPASVGSTTSYAVTATSVQAPTASGSATVTVTTGSAVTVSPRIGTVTLGQTQQFSATVPGGGGVTWSVDGVAGGNASAGTISGAGLYSPGSAAGLHTIVATSVLNGANTGSATVAVTGLGGVYTFHNDLARTGQNLQEYALTPATVSGGSFGKRWSCSVDGDVYAQPLYLANTTIAGGVHNVVIVATQHDSVYAFDADNAACVTYWKVSFLGTGITTVDPSQFGCTDILTEVGITGTPVVDPATGTIYVVAKTNDNGTVMQRLHALNVATGQERANSPVVIQASINDAGGNPVTFSALVQNQRPGLVLAGGGVYIGWGSHCDDFVWHGWLMRYDAATLAQTAVFNTTPNGTNGGIWMAGGAPVVDSSGSIFFATGNGTFDDASNIVPPLAPNNDFGESFVKLNPTTLAVQDYYTPSQSIAWTNLDYDIASAGVAALPDGAGPAAHPNLLVGEDKQGHVWVLDRTQLASPHYNASSDNVLQYLTLPNAGNCTPYCVMGTPGYWNGYVYLSEGWNALMAFRLTGGLLPNAASIATPTSQTAETYSYPNPTPMISAAGSNNGIVWALDNNANGTDNGSADKGPAILRAYDATNLGRTLYSSATRPADVAGIAVKFTVPVVANGHVYVAGGGQLTVYGLAP